MQSPRSARPSHGDYYVVTHDVATRLQVFRSAILTVPQQDDPIFENFHRQLHEKMQTALVNVTVHTIHIGELARTMWEKVAHLIGDRMVVSTCSEIVAFQTESFTLNVNRLFDGQGELVGYGSRPGCESMEAQFGNLIAKAAGKSIVLAEEGAFTGGTIRFVLQELKARGADVSMLVVGFCAPTICNYIRESFVGELVVINEVGELVDWITDHDLIPFTPGCGRVREEKTEDGNICAYPYILPFGKMGEWTSLSEDIALELSKFCLGASIGFFDRFGKSDGSHLTIRDLVRSYPAVPIPAMLGESGGIPPLDSEVVDFLKVMLGKLD